MIIRKMTLSDVDAVYEIEVATFTPPWTRQDLIDEMTVHPFARYVVAEENGEVLGYAGAWIVPSDGEYADVDGHINNIAVRADMRRKGIGEKLLSALMRYASNLGADYLTLEVRRSNLAAQSLYRKLGFLELGVRKRYYEDNQEDALLMVCQNLPKPVASFSEDEEF